MTKEELNESHQDPANWKWGIIYYNKADKRIFPPKRSRYLGWTVNFANPWSILTMISVLALAIYAGRYIRHL